MPAVTGRIFIATSPERTFDFVADHRNALRFMHGFDEFRPLGAVTSGVGARVRARGRLLGVPVTATMEITAYERPFRLASRSYDGVEGTALWEFAAEEDGTLVTFASTYRLPPVVRGPLKHLAMRAVEDNTTQTLRKLKRALEEG
ncbi:MAG: SRPBCC family protein [Chloroflexi bacterium]|nr:SRPBCC family protein [Chloroflexota bacterium]